jgi:hypothetical protein
MAGVLAPPCSPDSESNGGENFPCYSELLENLANPFVGWGQILFALAIIER